MLAKISFYNEVITKILFQPKILYYHKKLRLLVKKYKKAYQFIVNIRNFYKTITYKMFSVHLPFITYIQGVNKENPLKGFSNMVYNSSYKNNAKFSYKDMS